MENIIKFFGGMDKIAHFGIGWAIASVCSAWFIFQNAVFSYGLIALAPFVGTLIVAFLSWCKEFYIDPKFEWKDILASVLGAVGNHIAFLIAVLFNYLAVNELFISSIIPMPLLLSAVIAFAGFWCKWCSRFYNKKWLNVLGTVFYALAIASAVFGVVLLFI